MSDLVRFGVSMDADLLNQLDRLVRLGKDTNRSELVRDMVRDRLVELRAVATQEEVIGTVTLIYDHHHSQVSRRLTQLQHDAGARIIATMHVHIDHHNCMEVIALRGQGRVVKDMAAALIGVKGVNHGKLVVTAANV